MSLMEMPPAVGFPDEEHVLRAWHEAGHAVVALSQGHTVTCVSLFGDRHSSEPHCHASPGPHGRGHPIRSIILFLLGARYAAGLVNPAWRDRGEDADVSRAIRLYETFRSELKEGFIQLDQEAAFLARHYRHEIGLVAEALLAKRRLTGADVAEALGKPLVKLSPFGPAYLRRAE